MTIDASHRTRTLWLCGALHAFTHMCQVALLPLYLLIKQDFHLVNDGQVTFLMTAIGISYYAASYPMGILADRVDRKMLLTVGLLINGLGFVGLGYAPNYPWAIAACILTGLGGSFYHPAATAMLADLFPSGTGKALGRVGIGAAVGFCFAPAYAGWRGEMAGWRAPVIELGMMGMVGAVFFAGLAPRGRGVSQAAPPRAHHHSLSAQRFWLLVLVVSFLFSLRDFSGAGMGTLSSLFLQQAQHFDPKSTGKILGLMFAAAIISNPLLGSLSDRSRLRLTCAVLSVAAVMAATTPWASRTIGVGCLVIYGFFFLSSYPMVEAALMESVPEKVRGRVFGFFISIGGVVASFAHWAMGGWVNALKETTVLSFAPLFHTLAGLIVISLLGAPVLNVIRKYSTTHRVDEDE